MKVNWFYIKRTAAKSCRIVIGRILLFLMFGLLFLPIAIVYVIFFNYHVTGEYPIGRADLEFVTVLEPENFGKNFKKSYAFKLLQGKSAPELSTSQPVDVTDSAGGTSTGMLTTVNITKDDGRGTGSVLLEISKDWKTFLTAIPLSYLDQKLCLDIKDKKNVDSGKIFIKFQDKNELTEENPCVQITENGKQLFAVKDPLIQLEAGIDNSTFFQRATKVEGRDNVYILQGSLTAFLEVKWVSKEVWVSVYIALCAVVWGVSLSFIGIIRAISEIDQMTSAE